MNYYYYLYSYCILRISFSLCIRGRLVSRPTKPWPFYLLAPRENQLDMTRRLLHRITNVGYDTKYLHIVCALLFDSSRYTEPQTVGYAICTVRFCAMKRAMKLSTIAI